MIEFNATIATALRAAQQVGVYVELQAGKWHDQWHVSLYTYAKDSQTKERRFTCCRSLDNVADWICRAIRSILKQDEQAEQYELFSTQVGAFEPEPSDPEPSKVTP